MQTEDLLRTMSELRTRDRVRWPTRRGAGHDDSVSPADALQRRWPTTGHRRALHKIENAGLRALTVEAVARRLGVSKGSAYHHFRDRRDLLRGNSPVGNGDRSPERSFAATSDARLRLCSSLEEAFITRAPAVIVQLMAATDDSDVAEVLERSTAARIDMSRRTFIALGVTHAEAEHLAIMQYAHYLGVAQLRCHAPNILSTARQTRVHVDRVEASLLARLS